MSKNINTYEKITIEALKELEKYNGLITLKTAKDEWVNTARRLKKSESIVKKGCPKGAFLGVLLSDNVKNIRIDKQTLTNNDMNTKNMVYGKEIIKLLQDKIFTINNKNKIWKYICENVRGKTIKHNEQMHVACAFFENGYIITE